MRRDQNGFTLIELLVVILIIGILAAIAIPAFLGQRYRAQDAAAKTFVRHAAVTMDSYWLDGNTYALVTVAKLQAMEPGLRNANGMTLVVPTSLTTTGYANLGVVSKSGNTFRITRAVNGVFTRTCVRTNVNGACRVGLTW